MKFGKLAVVAVISTLVIFNLILYGLLPPAQLKPAITYAQQARQAAQSDGELAGFDDFDLAIGEGWHAPEFMELDGATYQYSAQETATVTLTVGCAAPWTLEFAVLDRLIRPELPEITLTINGQPLTLTRERGLRRWIYQAQVEGESAGEWALGIGVSDIYRPIDVMSEPDERLLGIPVDWVLITSPNCD